jgi:hypothetical protein
VQGSANTSAIAWLERSLFVELLGEEDEAVKEERFRLEDIESQKAGSSSL